MCFFITPVHASIEVSTYNLQKCSRNIVSVKWKIVLSISFLLYAYTATAISALKFLISDFQLQVTKIQCTSVSEVSFHLFHSVIWVSN
jgi:1,2-phenylacetyl-CoA epoxidase catalytic subunit